MAADANGVFLVGRLTRDAVTKELGGAKLTEMRLAFTSREKRDGEWRDHSNFIDVGIWGNEGLIPYLVKGKQIAVVGQLRYREWTATDGTPKSVIDVRASEVQLIGGGGKEKPTESPAGDDDNIPF